MATAHEKLIAAARRAERKVDGWKAVEAAEQAVRAAARKTGK